ncbi:Cryptochrome/photolyase FAD-binding domain-containing protein [Durotheca rogersii]|uniref:Cryptochrome/photolyase FAD-binding domain-containing protein n=1 Tax=Durotheca rogersii TaxID=419775 RepID=UPI00221FE828|nr:Cryptochrome/photolyase FAD-binding domain-containing protein [Durotheca rogersii]KAI5863204.1 Cryptochrome/photolyase FAD-binding domain-containing protein [Durotheca rogersii]
MGNRVIYWFRTDLRLHDSPALKAALDLHPDALWPIFTWDPHYVYRVKGGVNRWQYLLDCQADLSRSIQKLNPKSKLFVLREAPQTLFPKIFKAWNVTHLVFEKDTDVYARERDSAVVASAEEAGVQVITRYGRTLWDSDELVAKNGGKPTMSITQLQAAGRKIGGIPRPIPAPRHLPDPGEMPVSFGQDKPGASPDINAPYRSTPDECYSHIAGPAGKFAVASLEELGFSVSATTPHRGGETIALERLQEIFSDEKYAATFQKPKTSPAAFEPQSTTLLSPFLHFGALSPRLFYWHAQDLVEKYGEGASTPPESLTGQLLFRDMYFAAQAAIGPSFAQTLGNGHCRFIPWHLPSKVEPTGLANNTIAGRYHVDSPQADRWFQRWKAGVTGFPFVDALMRQLRAEGWIHHLGRHMVACFLTRGGCYVHWERGADVFEEFLLDHEPACNAGNWQWLSCTAFYSQYYRCYSPVAFGQKWDKTGEFIRRWVPELKDLDEKFIYEPWTANQAVLDKAGVRVEGDGLREKRDGVYPSPMFDFGERRRACLAAMKRAYSIGLYGDDERVEDGTWKELFERAGETEMEGLDAGDADGEHADDVGDHGDGTEDGIRHKKARNPVVKEGPMDKHVKKKRKT